MMVQITNCQAGYNTFKTDKQTDIKSVPCITIVNCIVGTYEIYINGEKYIINQGECFYTPEGAEQVIIHHLPEDGGYMQAQWLYMTVLVNNKFDLKKYYDIPVKLSGSTGIKIGEYISEYKKHTNTLNLTSRIKRNYLEYAVLHELIENGSEIPFNLSKKLENAILYIDENLHKEITISDISKAVNYSESYLFQLFKDELGVSPQQYVMKQKLSKACDLLIETDLSVGRISDSLGFCDQFHFSKKFRTEYRCTPSEYRKNYACFRLNS